MIWNVKCQHTQKKIWHIFAMIIVFCVFRFVFLYFVNYILNWIKRYCKNQANTIIDLHSVFILWHMTITGMFQYFFPFLRVRQTKKNVYNIERWWITFSIAGSKHSIEFHLIQYYFPLRFISFAIFITIFSLLPFLCSHWYNIGSIFCGFFLNFSFFFFIFFSGSKYFIYRSPVNFLWYFCG